MSSPLNSRKFGTLADGRKVDLWTLTGRGGLQVEAMTWGGIVTRLLAPDSDGKLADVVLGFNDLESYLAGHPYFGAIVGRVAGRIAGAAFTLDGHTYQLAANESPNHLHGGLVGFDKRLWEVAPVERADGAPSLRLAYFSPDDEEGYPGNVNVAVTYTVTDENVFLIETEATSDQTTPLCLTHHSYFNLAGEGSGTIDEHRLTIHADRFVPVDDSYMTTGRVEPTDGTDNDFQSARRLGDAIPVLFKEHGAFYRLPDHDAVDMVVAARLEEQASGRVLTVSTTERYLQLYTSSLLGGTRPGKSGKIYARFEGVCLECQGYPDASNTALRSDILLHPGQTQRHRTAYAFSVKPPGDASPKTKKRM
jgi:aldose 1-epimerase